MTRFRGRPLVAVASAIALVLTGCGKVDNGGSPPPQQGGQQAQDNRAVKAGGTLRVALDSEPDKLDPTISRTLVGTQILHAICDPLYDINEKLELVPRLAAALPETSSDGLTVTIKIRSGVKFADGTMMDAAAVKTSLDRHRTMEGSNRKSEVGPVTEVTVKDPTTVEIHLSSPYTPLASQLTDRVGMVMSPTALTAKGADFGTAPVCAGPFKFLTRVAQDRTEVVKDPNYFDAAKVKLDKIIFKTIADTNTRFTNLQSGDIDVQLNVSPINVEQLKGNTNLRLLSQDSLGYQGITVNLGNTSGLGKAPGQLAAQYASPISADPRVRKALSLSIDREALVRTVWRNVYKPACSPIAKQSPLSSEATEFCPKHDVAEAKRLLQEAGVQTPVKVSLMIINDPDARRLGEALKAMAAEGGFDITLNPTEFASALDLQDTGKYQMFRIGWSGRIDADGNVANFFFTKGSQNAMGYSNSEVDSWLNDARSTQDVAKRRDLYGKVIKKIQDDNPIIYLYRTANLIGLSSKVGQLVVYADYTMHFDKAGFVE
jgi:peptide/nickel transport system substrate-binding protein